MAEEAADRDSSGKWQPGKSGSPETKWGPSNPPPRSPGRPKKDAWLRELEGRLEDPRIRQALADRLLKVALRGSEKAALTALAMVQDRTGGPVVKRLAAELDTSGCGVLVAPAGSTPEEWIARAMEANEEAIEPGTEDKKKEAAE